MNHYIAVLLPQLLQLLEGHLVNVVQGFRLNVDGVSDVFVGVVAIDDVFFLISFLGSQL